MITLITNIAELMIAAGTALRDWADEVKFHANMRKSLSGADTLTSEMKFWAYGHFACNCPQCQAAYAEDIADCRARIASWQEEEDYCNANGDTIGAEWANVHKRDTSFTLNDMTPAYDSREEWERDNSWREPEQHHEVVHVAQDYVPF